MVNPVAIPAKVMAAFSDFIMEFQKSGLPPHVCVDFLLDRAALLVVTCANGALDDVRDTFIESAQDHFRANTTKALLMYSVPMGEA